MAKRKSTKTPEEIVRGILELHPDLTFGGYAVGDMRRISLEERAAEIRRARDQMLTPWALDQFERCCRWLDKQPKNKNINRQAGSSYGLKEEVEAESGYVSNGMFIASAIACGYLVERAGDYSLNAWLNISRLRPSNPNLPQLGPHPTAVRLLKQRATPSDHQRQRDNTIAVAHTAARSRSNP